MGEQEIVADQPPHWALLSAQEPAKILATRDIAGKEELLVRWQGSSKEEATWEAKQTLQTHYPHFP